MANSRTKNSILTILTSGLRQILTLVLSFLSRTLFIYTLGAEYLGLNGLFTNILSILALSELGIGSAIAFYLYKPLVNKDKERIKILMKFYKRCYTYVGLTILILGICIMPFLTLLINLEEKIPENLYFIYFIFLLQNACTYFFFAYKQTLVSANQELYKIEKLNILFVIINCLTDVLVLLIFKDFTTYLISKLLLVIIKNIVISNRIDKEYPYITEPCKGNLTKKEIKQFFQDLYSLAIFKFGSVLYNTLSNLIISIMIGTVVVGYYSNYVMIVGQITIIYMLIITAITAGVGNVIAKENKERQRTIFHKLSTLTYFVYAFFSICLFQLLNSFINLWIGNIEKEYILSQYVVLFICLNFYIDTSCQLDGVFRQASGNFKIGRYLQIIGGIINVILAIPLCKIYGLPGIFASQVISKLTTSYFPFLFNVEKTVFGFTKWQVLKQWCPKFLLTLVTSIVIWISCKHLHQTTITNFIIEILLTVGITLLAFYLAYRKSSEYKEITEFIKMKIKKQQAS